mmetsp:Transcript_10892/g.21889  ORF Transcript_10892/g.21889 Transcript_10892/m.21889 type:complete len:251 (-) Transcript_10892:21-773(-)
MVSSYLRTWLSDPGSVPQGWVPGDVSERGEQPAGVLERDAVPIPKDSRFCKKCDNFKPPRSQHCKQCGKCILRMDHHCPWVQNCVGENNTKFFILFLFYATTTCLYYSVCVIWFLWDFMSRKVQQRARFHEVSGYLGLLLGTEIIVICLTLMLGSLCWWNVYLMVRNQTSIENYDIEAAPSRHRVRGKRLKHRYDMGTFKNMQSVLGHSPLLWLLPVSKDPPPSGSSSRGNECDDERLEMQGILPPQPAE